MTTQEEATGRVVSKLHEPVPIPDSPYTLLWTDPARLTADERSAIAAMLDRAFNGKWGWAEPVQHFTWKILGYPGPTAIRLIHDGDRIIGTQCRLWRRFLLEGNECTISDGVDEALDPEYQGQGLKTRRQKVAPPPELPGRCLSFGFGTHPTSATRRGLPRERVPLETTLEAWSRPLNPWRLVRSRVRSSNATTGTSRTATVLDARKPQRLRDRIERLFGMGVKFLQSLVRRRPRAPRADVTIVDVERFGLEAEAFWNAAAPPFTLIQVRDQTFLNWRYAAAGAGAFTIRRAEADGRMLGYAVFRATPDEAVLADLLVLPDRLDVARTLVDDAIRHAKRAGAPHLRTWMTDTHPYRTVLEETGFVTYPQVMTFNLRPRDCSLDQLTALTRPGAAIHMMPGDSDHI